MNKAIEIKNGEIILHMEPYDEAYGPDLDEVMNILGCRGCQFLVGLPDGEPILSRIESGNAIYTCGRLVEAKKVGNNSACVVRSTNP